MEFNENIRPICLPGSGDNFPIPNQKLIAVGWGRPNGNFIC